MRKPSVFVIIGSFLLSLWVVSLVLLVEKSFPPLVFGALGIIAIVCIVLGSNRSGGYILYAIAGILLGIIGAFSWYIYDFGVIITSVATACLGSLLLVFGLAKNE